MNLLNDVLQKALKDCLTNVMKNREELIVLKLQEKGIEISLEEEAKRRFKRISIETEGGPSQKMTVWYDDGSENGLRIITFFTEFVPDASGVKMNLNYF